MTWKIACYDNDKKVWGGDVKIDIGVSEVKKVLQCLASIHLDPDEVNAGFAHVQEEMLKNGKLSLTCG